LAQVFVVGGFKFAERVLSLQDVFRESVFTELEEKK
jgi:hypothetical protein